MDSRTDLGAKPTSTRPIAILSPFSAIPAPNPPATGQPLSVSPKRDRLLNIFPFQRFYRPIAKGVRPGPTSHSASEKAKG